MESGEKQNDLMALPELARYLKVASRTVYLWAQQGKIPGFKLGSSWRFRRTEIDHWMESQRFGPDVGPTSTLTDPVSQIGSKYEERAVEAAAIKNMIEDCKQDILRKLDDDSRDVWTVQDTEDFYGNEITKIALNGLRKEKKISLGEEKGLQGQKVQVIRRR